MSGFVGFTNFTYRRENTELVLKQMTDSILKRGTDIEAYYDDRYTHIGYRCRNVKNMELKKKSMTFTRMDNEYMIVWDGELINKLDIISQEGLQIETGEDEEVVLKLFDKVGEKCVEKLQGIFSFAIWNKGKQEIYLARDYLGIKPLFYLMQDSNFIFASELKAILQFPNVEASISEFGIARLLLHGVIDMKEKPLFKDIQALKPGFYLIFQPNQLRVQSYIPMQMTKIKGPVIKTIENPITLTKEELRKIVTCKDTPDRIGADVLLIKDCEKVEDSFETSELFSKSLQWKGDYNTRKKLISPHLKIDLEEFYQFQKERAEGYSDFTSIDRIATRFGYHVVLPKADFVIDTSDICSIFYEMIEKEDSPIWTIVNRNVSKMMINELDFEVLSYLIEVNLWMEEYNVKIS